MNNEFVTYEIAKKLRELGFDENCLAVFDLEGEEPSFCFKVLQMQAFSKNSDWPEGNVVIPLWQQAIDFWQEKGIYITQLVTTYSGETAWKVSDCRSGTGITEYGGYKREDAILKAFELIEKKK